MNKLIISGRLCADMNVVQSQEGKSIARFNFAVNRRFKREGEPEADFFQCVAFGKTAETLIKCSVGKGTKLLIDGELRNNNYEKDGVMQYGNQVIVNTFEFCESKASGGMGQATQAPQTDEMGFTIDDNEDDLPF